MEACVHASLPHLISLRRVRVFDSRLWRAHATELPALLPPETAAQEIDFEYTYSAINIQQKGHFVFQNEVTANFLVESAMSLSGDDDDDDDDKGSDFDPDIDPSYDDISDDGYSSADDNTSASEDNSSLDMGEEIGEWEPDPEKALAVFRSILES